MNLMNLPTSNAANTMLGLLLRSSQTGRVAGSSADFGNVRSILEHGCVICGGTAKRLLHRLEIVQQTFLIWFAFQAHTSRPSHAMIFWSFSKSAACHRRYQSSLASYIRSYSAEETLLPCLEVSHCTILEENQGNLTISYICQCPFPRLLRKGRLTGQLWL